MFSHIPYFWVDNHLNTTAILIEFLSFIRYEQQLEELRTTQTDIVSELQKKQKSSDEAKTDVTVLETEVNDAEMEKHNVSMIEGIMMMDGYVSQRKEVVMESMLIIYTGFCPFGSE